MNVYVETNFVLEVALLQEQHASCLEIIALCEDRRIRLVVPAFCLVEPFETLVRHQKRRRKMKHDFDRELSQIARTATYAERLDEFRGLTDILINIAQEEATSLDGTIARLIDCADVVPLDGDVMRRSGESQAAHGLSPQDSLVYASVVHDLAQVRDRQSCFLNRNTRDFDDQNIVDELHDYNCTLLPRFDAGHRFILDAI